MDKKEIIINNVNVAECEFLRKCVIPDNEGCAVDDSLCCDVGNCYFKQLKRLQEENKRLNQELDIKEKMLDKFMIGSGETLEKLQEENERLKKRQITKNGFICDCEQNAKYKQALKEIREMTSVNTINTCWEILNTCDDCKSKKDCGIQSPITKLKFIENKINEVLNEN